MKKAITFLLLAISITSQATVWRVNNNPGQNQYSGQQVFNNLQLAISNNLVVDGDTLYVEPSTISYGDVVINKRLHLIGAGYFLNLNPGLQQNVQNSVVRSVTFEAGSSGSSLEGLYLFSGSNSSVTFSNTPLEDIVISRCYGVHVIFTNNATNPISDITVKGNYLNQVLVGNNSAAISGLIIINNRLNDMNLGAHVNAVIVNNVIEDNVNIYGQPFYNNICLGTTQSDLSQNNNSVTNIYNNIFVHPQPAWFTGNTNNTFGLTTAYIFANYANPSTDGKFALKPAGQCAECYAGFPSGTQLGIFGGAEPYKLSGIPPIPSVYQLQHPANVSPGGTLNITISTRSNN